MARNKIIELDGTVLRVKALKSRGTRDRYLSQRCLLTVETCDVRLQVMKHMGWSVFGQVRYEVKWIGHVVRYYKARMSDAGMCRGTGVIGVRQASGVALRWHYGLAVKI